jgi:hypothetical protein
VPAQPHRRHAEASQFPEYWGQALNGVPNQFFNSRRAQDTSGVSARSRGSEVRGFFFSASSQICSKDLSRDLRLRKTITAELIAM